MGGAPPGGPAGVSLGGAVGGGGSARRVGAADPRGALLPWRGGVRGRARLRFAVPRVAPPAGPLSRVLRAAVVAGRLGLSGERRAGLLGGRVAEPAAAIRLQLLKNFLGPVG